MAAKFTKPQSALTLVGMLDYVYVSDSFGDCFLMFSVTGGALTWDKLWELSASKPLLISGTPMSLRGVGPRRMPLPVALCQLPDLLENGRNGVIRLACTSLEVAQPSIPATP
jgi:hypothetical protein